MANKAINFAPLTPDAAKLRRLWRRQASYESAKFGVSIKTP
jgi:hypothetical protein